ncbi:type IX secretion system protein PorG [Williamwhitmania taraxaci]|uniref:DUF6089 domain-containing protein n=1 Tax=Williamwhitmania taraxaci TaxID=1640674 RepID=A0A1G6HNP3_9BACT|nr:DUF6089 family protein [Williamwhitmania taraxaci]SDB95860.1 hypothetical protein SAMN05216323_101235 [Williamwhitmania taraxaci]
MRKLFFVSIFLILSLWAVSQNKTDIGFRLGATYYIGDYNESLPFSSPSFAGGGFIKYNFNDYYAARFGLSGGSYTGSYNASAGYLPAAGGAFSSLIIDGCAAFEVNFLPFSPLASKGKRMSPFTSIGIGVSYDNGQIIPVIPLSIGVKYRPAPRWTVGVEWILTKTFSDKMDGYTNLTDQKKTIFHNNDWYSVAGLFITFRLLNNRTVCPVYQ